MKIITLITIVLFSIKFNVNAQNWNQVSDGLFEANSEWAGVSFSYDDKGYWLAPAPGSQVTYERKVYVYDPNLDEWTKFSIGSYPGRQVEMGCFYEGKAYFGFGEGATMYNDLWVFDPGDMSFTQLASCPEEGRSVGSMVGQNGKIYAGCGAPDVYNGNWEVANHWWAYDIATDTWEQKEDYPDNEGPHRSMEFTVGDYIYVFGGHNTTTWYKYSINSNEWINVNDTIGARHVASEAKIYNGKVYIYGGDADGHQAEPNHNELLLEYDPIMDAWRYFPGIPSESTRYQPGTFILNEKFYVFGGAGGNNDKSVWYFDLNQLETTSTNDHTLRSEKLIITPNPASEIVTLQNVDLSLPNLILKIYNINGQQVYSGKVATETLNLTSLSKGTYIFSLFSENTIYKGKVIKK